MHGFQFLTLLTHLYLFVYTTHLLEARDLMCESFNELYLHFNQSKERCVYMLRCSP